MLSKRRRFITSFFIVSATVGIIASVFFLIAALYGKKIVQSDYYKEIESPEAHVLFISSYDITYFSVLRQIRGIHSVFDENNISFDVEFMDTKRFTESEVVDNFYKSLKYKLNTIKYKYDAILLADDAALDFGEKYQDELFAGIPIVFFCVNSISHANRAVARPLITGYAEEIFLEDTLNVALRLNPGAKSVTAIYDETPTGYGDWIQFRNFANRYKTEYKNFDFYGINTTSLSRFEFASSLSHLDDSTILMFLSAVDDKQGNVYSSASQVEFIVKHSKIPVYRYNTNGLGQGILGGKTVDFETEARNAALLVLDILEGTNMNFISLKRNTEGLFYFDNDVIQRFNLDESKLPKDAVIINKKISAIKAYAKILAPCIFLVLSLGALLIIAETSRISSSRHARKLVESRNEMEYMARHDYLTKLPNRFMTQPKIEAMFGRKKEFYGILLDIDNFKSINDFYTHSFGDEVLRQISARFLKLAEDRVFFISRFGGDEFFVLYSGENFDEDSHDLVRLQGIFSDPVEYKNTKVYVQASMGVASSLNCSSPDELIVNADIAMYESKRAGKNRCTFFRETMKTDRSTTDEIEAVLKDCIENDGFKVLYQPQIDVDNGVIYGYEALVRIKDNSLPPSQFIPIAEEKGYIIDIGRKVTEKVVQQIAEWRSHGMALHKVSINYSYGQISDTGYVNFLRALLKQYDISPALICIEITESLFIENKDKAIKLFDEFTKLGVTLSLDDFGTGYSSLSYLTYIPVETVKLDKSLIDHYLNSANDLFIKNIVRLVHSLNMRLVVEGVEFKWQFNKLKTFHCDYIQGYLFSKPISGNDVEAFARKRAAAI